MTDLRGWWALAIVLCMPACGQEPNRSDTALGFCDALPILQNKCQRCHADPTENGAPFPLVTYEDVHANSRSLADPGRERYEDMQAAIESDDMPFRGITLDPPVEPLTCEEKTTLLAWLADGAPGAPQGQEDCAGVEARLLACQP